MAKIFERHKLSKCLQGELGSLNCPVPCKGTGFAVKPSQQRTFLD